MLDFTRKGGEMDGAGSDYQSVHSAGFSRRRFLAKTSCFGAFYAVAKLIPLPTLAAELASDSRVSQAPLVDKGFASVRKVGSGLYATISDPSKGMTTICNGGFLGRKRQRAADRRIHNAGGRFVPDGRATDGQPGAREGRSGHALSLRPLDGKFVLRDKRSAAVGACDRSETHHG